MQVFKSQKNRVHMKQMHIPGGVLHIAPLSASEQKNFTENNFWLVEKCQISRTKILHQILGAIKG